MINELWTWKMQALARSFVWTCVTLSSRSTLRLIEGMIHFQSRPLNGENKVLHFSSFSKKKKSCSYQSDTLPKFCQMTISKWLCPAKLWKVSNTSLFYRWMFKGIEFSVNTKCLLHFIQPTGYTYCMVSHRANSL